MNPDGFWTGMLAGAGMMLLAILTFANKSDWDTRPGEEHYISPGIAMMQACDKLKDYPTEGTIWGPTGPMGACRILQGK